MRPEDRAEFARVITGAYDFYGKELSDFALSVWWQSMQQFDLVAVREALGKHCMNPDTGQFLPRPADVVRMMEGSTLDSAVVAWTKVDRAVQVVGTYATVAFDDPLIHRVLTDMGGWPQLGRKPADEWPFVAKEFQTRYRGFKTRKEKPEYPPKLPGIFDMHNDQRGFSQQPVTLIGNTEQAKRVYLGGDDKPQLTFKTLALPELEDVA